ncbi:myb-like protein X [Helianthus annuus]|uniref:myb-like protein X n=1 Tax=Helianthus annuus TaxID=4232 RepID=UPI000B907B94|nr:myb-like protein X [Helianthus annuus]
MMLDHAYPNLVKDEQNDLMMLHHMDNETLIRLSKYTKKWPEPKKTEFFGYIKDEKYEDPDPVSHLKWRNDTEMKEKSAADELTKLADFCETRNDWYTKEEKKKREEDETEANVERDQDQLSSETERLIKDIDDTLEARKSASKIVVDDEEKGLSSSEDEGDAEVDKWIKENYDPRDREKQNKRKRSADDDDETYVPPPENVQGVQTPSSRESTVLEKVDDFSFVNDDLVKELQKKGDEVLIEKKKLEERVKSVESENSSLLKKIEADQSDIDILEVRIAELEEEKARRDEQNKYFKLKNKELEANNAKKEHEAYMMKKVLENLIGKPIEQRFEEIEVEEVRARREAEIEAGMKDKGKGVPVEDVAQVTEKEIVVSEPTKVLDPCPISSVDDDDNGNDDDDQGTSGIKVTEASQEEKIDEYLHDDANEEPENASGKGEHGDAEKDDENVDKSTRLILHLEHDVEEGEILHTYTRAEIVKMMVIEDSEFNFDFEEELNKFDINQQPEYQYKYVEDADNYDKVEVED